MLEAAPDEMVHPYGLRDIHVVVVGGGTNGYGRIVEADFQKTVSIDEWG